MARTRDTLRDLRKQMESLGVADGWTISPRDIQAARAAPRLSALVVAHNEAEQLAACLETLGFADEIVVVLDRCTDASKQIASEFTECIVEGAWPIEGPRRHAGIAVCSGDWILEVDADERVPEALAWEIRATIARAKPGYFLIPGITIIVIP